MSIATRRRRLADGFGGLLPDVGVALISLTPDAAAWETNVWGVTFAGY